MLSDHIKVLRECIIVIKKEIDDMPSLSAQQLQKIEQNTSNDLFETNNDDK